MSRPSHALRRLLGALAVLALALPASAEALVTVSTGTLRVADLDPSAPAELADIELGRAPPPGSSRVLSKKEVFERVREAGADPRSLRLPATVRVASAAERWQPTELAQRAEGAVRAALPAGVTLVRLAAVNGVTVPPGTTVAGVRPVFQKRAGRQEITLSAELRAGDLVVARAPLRLTLDVSEEALAPAVRKGDRLTLVVDQGNARIGANAVALADANLGDTVFFKVTHTGKVLKAKVRSRELAMVVEL